ncbi:MAG: adenylate/guanylate cyclase domain-containing protein [Elusimicrobiota bacterium]
MKISKILIPLYILFLVYVFVLQFLSVASFVKLILLLVIITSFVWIILHYKKKISSIERKYHNILTKYLDPKIVKQLVTEQDELHSETEKRSITIMFIDIRGYTSLAEKIQPEKLVKTLNEYLEAITNIIIKFGGTVDKFIGDGILCFFGNPTEYADHPLRAIKSALVIQNTIKSLNKQWIKTEQPLIHLGIGINTGEVIIGNIGGNDRMDYTVIGDNVNITSRLCDIAEAEQIIVSELTYEAVKENVEAKEFNPINLKGKQEPIKVYEILNLK